MTHQNTLNLPLRHFCWRLSSIASLAFATLGLFTLVNAARAGEFVYSPSCQKGECAFQKVLDVRPYRFVKDGVVMKYRVQSIERECDNAKDYSDQACSKPPQDSEYARVDKNSFAMCSTRDPWVANSADKKSADYVKRPLDPATAPNKAIEPTLVEYFVVCHGWQADPFSDSFPKFADAKGYTPINRDDRREVRVTEAALLSEGTSQATPQSRGGAVALADLSGNWFTRDRKACRGKIGFTSDLTTFRRRQIDEAETRCNVEKEEIQGATLKLEASCATEGTEYRQTRYYLRIDADRVREAIVENGKKVADGALIRCK